MPQFNRSTNLNHHLTILLKNFNQKNSQQENLKRLLLNKSLYLNQLVIIMLINKKIILLILIAISPPTYSRYIVIHNGYWNILFKAKNEKSISTYTDYYISENISCYEYLICFLNDATISLVNETVVIKNDLHYRKKFNLNSQKKPFPSINKDNFESILKLLKESEKPNKSHTPHINALVRAFSPWTDATNSMFLERLEDKLKAANTSRQLTLCPERINSIYYQPYKKFSTSISGEGDIYIHLNKIDEKSTSFDQEHTSPLENLVRADRYSVDIKKEKEWKKQYYIYLKERHEQRRLAQLKRPIAYDELTTVFTGPYSKIIDSPALGDSKKDTPNDKQVAPTRAKVSPSHQNKHVSFLGDAGYSIEPD
ncbi:MAG: hypothetical protein PUP46_07570 [Endozoicomonas sp. (ex Botrylloides leachii)]|nr:hypothetical protein [Endozoicomonas sp. (ex Botrylloides leachii)]